MSEGEFKKRIKAFRNNTHRLKVFSDEEATMIQNSMVLLVAEAKQDFPEGFIGEMDTLAEEESGTGDSPHHDQLIKISKWFVKWFGENK